MKLKSPANKGKRFEYFIRDLLRGYGFEARRTPMSGAIEGWSGDITAPDFPLYIECKNTAKTTFPQWWEKANNESQGKPPVIFWNHKGEAYAFMLVTDLMNIITSRPTLKQPFKKPTRPQKEDKTVGLAFSKSMQTRRKASA